MGKVIMSGIVPPLEYTAPIKGILASDLAIGSSVYLMENGVATEYLVVNQGIPSGSSLYDASCDGTWLLRKDVYENRAWHSSKVNDYENSTIHSYLNSTFFDLLGATEQATTKQIKIPYRAGSGYSTTVTSGSNGLSTKIFILSGYEVGWTRSASSIYLPDGDGACLSYFNGTAYTDAKRIAYLSGIATNWWLRSPSCGSDYGTNYAFGVTTDGSWYARNYCTTSYGIRPALVVPSNALFDKNTLILKGVA